jgi:peptide/nickel transport system substrate-binding protein
MPHAPLRITAVCLGSLLLAVVGSQSGSATGHFEHGDTLRIVVSQDFRSIEPALVQTGDGQQIMEATQVGLLSYADPGSGERGHIVPYGAVRLPTISRDLKTYVFRIRRGVRLSDGTPVTASNFAAGLDRLLDPRMKSQRAFLFKEVRGARSVMTGKVAHVSGVVAKKDRLIIHLSKAVPDFLDRLALPVLTAIPLDLPVVSGGVDAPLPSAGPYYVKEYVPGQRARLVKNPFWKHATRPSRKGNVDEIVYVGRAPETAADLVERGEADIVTFAGSTVLPAEQIRGFWRRYGVNRDRFWARQMRWRMNVIFNLRRPLFRNVRLRRAVNFALDRTQLAAAHGPFGGSRTDQLVLPRRPGFRDWKLYPFRPDFAAARTLARGAHPRIVSLYVPDTESGRTVGSVVKANLARIGLRLNVIALESSGFHVALAFNRRWDLAAGSWSTSRDDPLVYINYPLEGKTTPIENANVGLFDDPSWIGRMRRVARMTRGRLKAFALLDRDLMQKAAPLAPYLAANALTLFSTSVGCPSFTNDGYPNLAALCLD